MIFLALFNLCIAFSGPQNISSLLYRLYPDGESPEFTPLPSAPNVAVALNDTAMLKIHDLIISPYPLRPGHVKFWLSHELLSELPLESKLKITSFVGDEPGYRGEIDLCSYTKFAKFECPINKYDAPETIERTLLVPEDASSGRFSFLAEAFTPGNDHIAKIAGIVDLDNDGPTAELGVLNEEQVPIFPHDEL